MSLQHAQVKFVRSISWVDLFLFLLITFFIYALIGVAAEWTGPFHSTTEIKLGYWALPRYAFFSLFRGFVAYFLSLGFTIVYGYVAAHSRLAERILIPLLDILQSIPVLGFLPGVVLVLVQFFPHSNIGLELACVLMIFTGQVWNMTFSFYASVKGVPGNLRELALLCRLRRWEILRKVEFPHALNGLLWNSMLSMAGGWFFLMVVESFTLGDQGFRLPGIGSYMAVAIESGRAGPVVAGILAMIIVIVLVDRCLWAPLVYLSERFNVAGEGRKKLREPLALAWLNRSQMLRGYYRFLELYRKRSERKKLAPRSTSKIAFKGRGFRIFFQISRFVLILVGLGGAILGGISLFQLLASISWLGWLMHLRDTLYTFLRVAGAVALGTLCGTGKATKFMGGLTLENMLADMFYIQPELNLLPAGVGTWIAVPILLKAKFDAGGFKPYIILGPEFGLKISGTGLKSINFSLPFGAGGEFEVSPGVNMFLEGRYSLGLTNINSTAGISTKLSGIQFMLGVSFPV